MIYHNARQPPFELPEATVRTRPLLFATATSRRPRPPCRPPTSIVARVALSLAVAGAALGLSVARADVPRVASDIPPVHSLVALVMGDLGTPTLVVRPGASPHGHALRPSEAAAALEASDVVFWTGTALTPWLAREIGTLAPDAVSVELMALPGTRRLAPRESATFETHDHDHHARDEHDGDLHATGHDAHGDAGEHGGGDGTDPAAYDPHGWLDPLNAMHWLDAIADVLARLDPPDANVYAANAAAARRSLEALVARTDERLTDVRGRGFVVFHDSFHYFEERFGTYAVAALSANDASDASPARVHAVRSTIERLGAGCVFTEPQLDARRARLLVDGLDVGRGVLDPLGADIEPGPALYERLIDAVAHSLVECLGGPSRSDG